MRTFAPLAFCGAVACSGMIGDAELTPLARPKIAPIELAAARVPDDRALDTHGNSVPLVGRFLRADGRAGTVVDAYLRFRPLTPPVAANAMPRGSLGRGRP